MPNSKINWSQAKELAELVGGKLRFTGFGCIIQVDHGCCDQHYQHGYASHVFDGKPATTQRLRREFISACPFMQETQDYEGDDLPDSPLH